MNMVQKNVYACLQIQKWYLFKLFQEMGGQWIKESDGGGEFKYSIFDTLKEIL
jgi:hypothetical protein